MELRRFMFCVFLFHISLKTVVDSRCPEVASTVGTNFVFGVPAKIFSPDNYIYVHITTVSDLPAHVRVTAPFINYDQQLTVHNSTVVSLNQSLVQTQEGVQFKGIEVFSDSNVTVAVIPYYGAYHTEGFLVLPTSALSTRYIAASYQPYSSNYNSVLVVGTEINTNVFIKYKTNIAATYEYRNVTLQKFETFQVLNNYDLSGVVVISNKPVAVLSGSVQSTIPVGLGNGNCLVEQMIPTKYWVNQFIVPPIYPHNYFVVRIFVDENNTEIHCYNSTNHFAVYLDQGSMHEVMFGSDPAVILANKPISVIQYCTDNENMFGNPFMTTVQGISQYVSSYQFHTDLISGFYSGIPSTLALTVTKNSFNGLQLNGRNISSWNAKTVPVPKPMDDSITVFINISYNSFHTMIHVNREVFGATLYGLLDYRTVYGYPLQLSLSTTDCEKVSATPSSESSTTISSESSTTISSESSTTTSSERSTQRTTTFNSHVDQNNNENVSATTPFERSTTRSSERSIQRTTTFNSQVNQKSNGSWCMECSVLSHLQFCDKVVRCAKDNEVCYVQAYTNRYNVQAFKTGCIARNKCQEREENVNCQHCCEGDFCNTAGCGDPGLPDLHERGPMCFDCSHHGDSDVCQAVLMCKPRQVCKIEKREWGSGYNYLRTCADPMTCLSRRSVPSISPRDATVCLQCCSKDFCNLNCTSPQNPAIIG